MSAGRDAADATAVWAPCFLQGPLKKTIRHVSGGISAQHSEKTTAIIFLRGQLNFPDSGINRALKDLKRKIRK